MIVIMAHRLTKKELSVSTVLSYHAAVAHISKNNTLVIDASHLKCSRDGACKSELIPGSCEQLSAGLLLQTNLFF